MSEPTFQMKGLRYNFGWADYKLEAQVSRISSNHDRTVCTLLFTSTHPDAHPHILQTRFNLESSRVRSELAKDMATRYKIKTPIDWKNVLEYISAKTLQEYEKGEPVIKITSTDEVKPLEYLIEPIAPLGKPTVIFGDPGVGKSQLCLILNMLIALPWTDNLLRLIPPLKPTIGLFLDYEADPDDSRRQLKSLTEGMGLGYIEFHYRRCSLPISDDVEAIRNQIEAIKAQCLFIDSTSLAAGGDLNKMDIATAYFRALRQLNTTTISLAHTSKDRDTRHKSIIGSVLWEAGARSIWECRAEEDEDSLDIALFHRKANLSKKSKPLGYRITYENSLPKTIEWLDPKSIPEFVQRMGTNQRIIELLKEGYKTDDEIVDRLEITANNCYVTTKRLKDKGIITKSGNQWGLVAK